MGSPLRPTLVDVIMCYFGNIWLENCPPQFKHVMYRKYVGDAFLVFRSVDHVEKFKIYLNKQYQNITFTSEIEQNGSFPFPDIKLSCENNKFVTSVYQKPTFSGVFTNFESFISKSCKRSLIDTLLHIGFNLCFQSFIRNWVPKQSNKNIRCLLS